MRRCCVWVAPLPSGSGSHRPSASLTRRMSAVRPTCMPRTSPCCMRAGCRGPVCGWRPFTTWRARGHIRAAYLYRKSGLRCASAGITACRRSSRGTFASSRSRAAGAAAGSRSSAMLYEECPARAAPKISDRCAAARPSNGVGIHLRPIGNDATPAGQIALKGGRVEWEGDCRQAVPRRATGVDFGVPQDC